MKAPYSLSCLLLLSLGTCFPPDDRTGPGDPGPGLPLGPGWGDAVAWKRSAEDLSSLFSMAKELQGFDQEQAGFRQQQERPGEEGGGARFQPRDDGEKRSGTLGSLAEELNGYNRKKGGFSFRFGRR
ncbi:PREDICTED: orexigenic neuropeptide QRFP [Crocodylus porosus]|uniref:Pyroglutamylated RFamide peptide n=1 Tax=Crocodylus porosus TaxID=8502 RepID=A0A7M4E7Z3_CROPO|nr:PREDICTED: orexigenic neuropeptide QRFP [Crocodylus porosus]